MENTENKINVQAPRPWLSASVAVGLSIGAAVFFLFACAVSCIFTWCLLLANAELRCELEHFTERQREINVEIAEIKGRMEERMAAIREKIDIQKRLDELIEKVDYLIYEWEEWEQYNCLN